MKINYTRLTKYEVQDFLDDAKRKIIYKKIGHTWRTSKSMSKQYCSSCGLVRLNNPFTRKRVFERVSQRVFISDKTLLKE